MRENTILLPRVTMGRHEHPPARLWYTVRDVIIVMISIRTLLPLYVYDIALYRCTIKQNGGVRYLQRHLAVMFVMYVWKPCITHMYVDI